VIKTFADRDTRRLFEGEAARGFPPEIRIRGRLKLAQLHAATSLEFMMLPPSNRLEPLKGDRKGQHSVRINQQWRLCFRWRDGNAFDVEIADYH
jgi:proteic killer suppression protein